MKLVGQEHNPVSGITTQWFVHQDGRMTVRGVQDVAPVLNHNRAVLNSKSAKSSKLNESEGLGTKVASIPNILVEQLMKKKGLNLYTCPSKDILKLLNDSDYSKLRTAHGRL
jgi:hypothetical protein